MIAVINNYFLYFKLTFTRQNYIIQCARLLKKVRKPCERKQVRMLKLTDRLFSCFVQLPPPHHDLPFQHALLFRSFKDVVLR